MSAGWIGFWCGLFLGAAMGMLALALCMAAKRADADVECMFDGIVPEERPRNTMPPHLPRM